MSEGVCTVQNTCVARPLPIAPTLTRRRRQLLLAVPARADRAADDDAGLPPDGLPAVPAAVRRHVPAVHLWAYEHRNAGPDADSPLSVRSEERAVE